MNFIATRIATNSTANIFDLVITNEPESIMNIRVLSNSQRPFPTDHFPVTFDFTAWPRLHKKPRSVYNYKQADRVALKADLLNSKLEDCIGDCSIMTNGSVRYLKLLTLVYLR